MTEQLANLGYLAIKPQAGATPVKPNIFIPLYKDDMVLDINVDEDKPIMGNRAARYKTIMGQRSHKGSVEVMAEPNTALYIFNMLLKQGSKSGSGPYTYPFTLDKPLFPFTIELGKGRAAHRFWGVYASAIKPTFDDNKMHFEVDIAALGAFTVREIASVSGSSTPWTIVFKTDYDQNPTTGLVVGDTLQIQDVSTGDYINVTVASVVDGTSITVTEDPGAAAAGDIIYLRPQTPSYALSNQFQLARTEYRFADTAANALTATQTRVENDSSWSLMHKFNDDEGEKRTGGYDPASIVHVTGDAQLDINVAHDTLEDYNRFLTVAKRACVVRHFITAPNGDAHELRVTLNNLRQKSSEMPLETEEIIYNEYSYLANYDASDGQMFGVTVINGLDV